MRRTLVLLSLLLPLNLLPLQATAAPPGSFEGAATVLRSGIETLTGYLHRQGEIPPQQLRAYLQREIAPYFDFRRMALWAAGPLNRHLSSQQRELLAQELKGQFLSTLVQELSGYRDSRLRYLAPRGDARRGDVTLSVQVLSGQRPPVQLDFRLMRERSGWRVVDVAANGASAVTHYRRYFTSMARRYGVEGLLARLDRS